MRLITTKEIVEIKNGVIKKLANDESERVLIMHNSAKFDMFDRMISNLIRLVEVDELKIRYLLDKGIDTCINYIVDEIYDTLEINRKYMVIKVDSDAMDIMVSDYKGDFSVTTRAFEVIMPTQKEVE